MRWRSSSDRDPAERRRHPPRRADPAGTGWCVGGCRDGRRRKRRGRTPPEATKAEFSSGPKSVSNELRDRLRGRSVRVGALKIPVGRVERPYGQPRGEGGPTGEPGRREDTSDRTRASPGRRRPDICASSAPRMDSGGSGPMPCGLRGPSRRRSRTTQPGRSPIGQGESSSRFTPCTSDRIRGPPGRGSGARFLPYRHGVTLRLGIPGGKRLSVVIPRPRGSSRTSIRALAAP
jgi:hypothetical protein